MLENGFGLKSNKAGCILVVVAHLANFPKHESRQVLSASDMIRPDISLLLIEFYVDSRIIRSRQRMAVVSSAFFLPHDIAF